MSEQRPTEPEKGEDVWYRGWECGWDGMASRYDCEPWSAYKGGADLDAPHIMARTWEALLDAIDAEEGDA